MRLLLDTHALIWAMEKPVALGRRARAALEDGRSIIMVSAVSAFEIATKHKLGKLSGVDGLVMQFERSLADKNFLPLPVTTAHAIRAGQLEMTHRDPFDRLLMGQALVESLTLVSNEAIFERFGVTRLWD